MYTTKTKTRFPSVTQKTDVSCIVKHYNYLAEDFWLAINMKISVPNQNCILSFHYSKIQSSILKRILSSVT